MSGVKNRGGKSSWAWDAVLFKGECFSDGADHSGAVTLGERKHKLRAQVVGMSDDGE